MEIMVINKGKYEKIRSIKYFAKISIHHCPFADIVQPYEKIIHHLLRQNRILFVVGKLWGSFQLILSKMAAPL